MFPRLAERRQNLGNQLSGGEQQMLAVGRALVLNPSVMLLDEPLEGLAPIIVDELLAALRRIIRDEGMSAILVEQNAKKILPRHRPRHHSRARLRGACGRQRHACRRQHRARNPSRRHRSRPAAHRPGEV